MAAPKDNILSLGLLTGTERTTFTKQREHGLKKSVNRPMQLQADFSNDNSKQQLRAMHLQQRWQELKERELTAQQHNRQLLQQFEEAQDTLREMLILTAAMKTIRVEYERYLEESSPRWRQQLREKTQAARKKRTEEYLRSCLKNTEERVTQSSADRPLLSQGPTTMPQKFKPPKHCNTNNCNQDGSPHLPYMQSSWLTHPQSQNPRFPIRAPYQHQGSSHVPPSFLPPCISPHPHSYRLQHLASTPGDHHTRHRQNPPGWASLEPDYPRSWAVGAAGIPSDYQSLWGQLYTEDPPPETHVAQVAGEETDTSQAPSSKRERRGGSRSLSQELDIKPVRLSGGHAESSESGGESSQVSREKRKTREERGRSHGSSSDRENCTSQESSRTSSAVGIAAVRAAQSSKSDASSEKGRTSTSRRSRRSGGLAVGSPAAEKLMKGSEGVESGSHKDESPSASEELESLIEESRSEKVENQNPDDKSESCEESGSQREEESTSVGIKTENGGGDEKEKQESSNSEQSSEEEKDEEDLDGKDDGGDAGEEEERDVEDDDEAPERNNTTEEEEETGAEEEMEEQESEGKQPDRLKKEDDENGKKRSASSQDEEEDEEESEGGEDNMEEEGESDEEEERIEALIVEPEEESDSDDCIISPQEKSKKIHVIPEEASEEDDEEEEEGSKTGSSDDDSKEFSDEDDIEQVLAPQEQPQKKEEKDLKPAEKPKGICVNVEIFKAERDKSTKSDHQSDSDEFDHFYD